MKVELLQTRRVKPECNKGSQETALLPAIDSWGAYWRTLVPIYLFEKYSRQDSLHVELFQSISQTLNVFPQLAGTLEPSTLEPEDGRRQSLKRPRINWGSSTPGGEFIEARTNVRIQSLLPRSVHSDSSFLWDRADQSLKPLFPQIYPKSSALRVQVTAFRCGGFCIALDFDHGMADAFTVGLFMQHWSATHSQMFAQGSTSEAPLPNIIFSPQLVESMVPRIDDRTFLDTVLLTKACELPTRRPDRRALDDGNNHINGEKVPRARPQAGPSAGVPYLLHISYIDYERITKEIRDKATVQITDQVAIISFLWASLNRARARATGRPPVDLHMALSFRWLLELPDGLIGSPLVAVMMDRTKNGGEGSTDAINLAVGITETLDKYDEDALLSLAYFASLRDSPTSVLRSEERQERMEFTSGVGLESSSISFGPHSPVFVGPSYLPVDNLFIMAEGIPKSSTDSSKWYKHGADLFFSVPQDVLQALLADPAFASFELMSEG